MHNTTIFLNASNSSGRATNGLIIVGLKPTPVPHVGGILLAQLDMLVFTPLPSRGLSMPARIPPAPTLCGIPVYVQVLQADPGAALGISFTPGLRLIPGS